MADLQEYREKRKFRQTLEPEGKVWKPDGMLRFVVQKHNASHLHYDFRLEFGGVLKSWAVPKGPSMNPADKRLAMMVEDHPLEYKDFEGTIPKGNYGAGTVMVWDAGTYTARETDDPAKQEDALKRGLQRGQLSVVLQGKKLRGEFTFVKTEARGENAWLLIKKRDEFAAQEDVLQQDRSVKSGRTTDEIVDYARKHGEVWLSNEKLRDIDLHDAPPGPMPNNIKPMLATLVEKPFDSADWLFEIKWDGYRAIAEVDNGKVQIYSRRGLSLNEDYKPIVQSLEKLGCDAVLDGEIVVLDIAGKPIFQLLQDYKAAGNGHLIYQVFDLLYLDGHDLQGLPLARRKEVLRAILPDLPHIRYCDHIEAEGMAFYKTAIERGVEGIIAKDKRSPYRQGERGRDWLKMKTVLQQEVVIGGFTEPQGSRKHFGALVIGVYEGDALVYVGHAGGGFSDRMLEEVGNALKPLVQKACPFKEEPKTNAPATWVRPELVCEVAFSEWTQDGHMRMPRFLGMRPDLSVRLVTREKPQPVREVVEGERRFILIKENGEQEVSIGGRKLKLTHLDKVYWPEDGYTKGDLIAYYREVTEFILPHLKDRPQSLHRHPNGIEGDEFWQKDAGEQAPDWMRSIVIHSESQEKDIDYILCQDEATLVYLANLGCIELNPWLSRAQHLDKPDFVVIDLDPEEIGFDKVAEAAQTVRGVLDEMEVESYCKTSGATGLHIYVPLGAKYTYDEARQFAQIISRLAQQRLPQVTSLIRSPQKRQGKVYLDCLQNIQGQTLAAPYSVRPRPGAPVSTPLQWEEVNPKLDPADFTMRTIMRRLEKVGDIFRPVLGLGIDMEAALRQLEARGKRGGGKLG